MADFAIVTNRGRVSGFRVNYRVAVADRWREVVRYDTAHGRPHMHRFWLRGRASVAPILPDHPLLTAQQALAWAREDLATNWKAYRARWEGSQR